MRFSFLILVVVLSQALYSQEVNRKINWLEPIVSEEKVDEGNYIVHKVLQFEGASFADPDNHLPVFYELINIGDIEELPEVKISEIEYEDIPADQLDALSDVKVITEDVKIETKIVYIKKRPYLEVYICPFVKQEGVIKRITGFQFKLEPGTQNIVLKKGTFASKSLLASGSWYKIKVKETGIYRLSYSELENMGFPNPQNARLYGYGAGMLPESPGARLHDDLVEIPVMHSDNAMVFYAEGPNNWVKINDFYYHSLHLYSDYMYYFITTDISSGKTMSTLPDAGGTGHPTVNTFNDYNFYEPEIVNLVKSGKEWYGNPMSYNLYENTSFYFKNAVRDDTVKLRVAVAAKASSSTSISVYCNNDSLGIVSISGLGGVVNSTTGKYANTGSGLFIWNANSDTMNIDFIFNKRPNYTEEAWMDYAIMNCRRKLQLYKDVLIFRDSRSTGVGKTATFEIWNATAGTVVWDVTEIHNIRQVNTSLTGNVLRFTQGTDSLREFVAFNNISTLPKPITAGDDLGWVENQDLHGMETVNYIILTPKEFIEEAEELATLHRSSNDIQVKVVVLDQVYNEFSSGTPDITAIRDFMKFLYERDESSFRYLLLFGDGNYDNKTRPPLNPNFIPTYQSGESLGQSSTYVTDDYFGILDNGEDILYGKLDIGVGRFPVQDVDEAQGMINKVKKYIDKSSMGLWRNIITFVGDDENGNSHMSQANNLATYINVNYPYFNTEKIFLDAYKQVTGATGASYPAVTAAINNRMKMGALFVNYTGHGGEQGLAHEKILTKPDISGWYNPDVFPIFFTATCEFSRFDDIVINGRTQFTSSRTAGELVVLNPDGGGIASYTTNRMVYGVNNFELNESFYNIAFTKNENEEINRFGDLIRLAKVNYGADANNLKFCLLGDPAIKLPCPKHKVVIDSVNGLPAGIYTDTIHALSMVNVSGHVETETGHLLDEFNGVVYPTIYDKPIAKSTLANDPDSYKTTFYAQDNILFKGRATIENGRFSFSFIVPKDINYITGNGKISLYAMNENEDATGYYNGIQIGGFNAEAGMDYDGPGIELFMNDSSFINGGLTNTNPNLFARVSDENGINTANSGIGHDITGILDEKQREPIILNEYFQSDIDDFTKGTVIYPFSLLAEGLHTLRVKVWDIYNNSSEEEIEFYVSDIQNLNISKLINYPNPVGETGTGFYFEHNQANTQMNVRLEIFSLNGDLIKVISYETIPGGYHEGPIEWDGKDDNGNPLSNGIYIYRVVIKSSNGEVEQKSDKLLILR